MTHTTHPYTDLPSALADLRGDTAALQLLAAKFIKRYPDKVYALSSAFQAKDFSILADHIHQLRGALGIFHATQAQSLAVDLEHKARYRHSLPREEFSHFMDELAGVALDLFAYLGAPAPLNEPDAAPPGS